MIPASSCTNDRDRNNTTSDEVSEDFEREKNELRDELRGLRNDIDRGLLEKVDNRLDRASEGKDKELEDNLAELEKANRDLSGERSRIDKALEDIESASEDTRADVKVAARNTLQEVKTAFQEIGNELEALFEDDDNDTQE